jgi:MinD-like ATPase involved in chromosome partitioning or flagellar assembly
MHNICWSAKGGSGTTVTACALALISARSGPTVLVDLGGDVPAALGVAEPTGPGVGDWLAAPKARPDALWRLAIDAADDLRVLPAGSPPALGHATWQRLVEACAASDATIVIDAGSVVAPVAVHRGASASLLVTRPCYLALRRAVRCTGLASGVVVVGEPGRALTSVDVERALGVPVVAEVPWDPAIARAVDAGLLASRMPQSLARPLRQVLALDSAA